MGENGPELHWALLQPSVIASPDRPGRTLISRLRVVETPWFAVYVHALRNPDDSRCLHDHPWAFRSLVVSGSYTETWAEALDPAVRYAASNGEVSGEGLRTRTWWPWSLHRIGQGEYHAITGLRPGRRRAAVWTVMFVGRRRTDWGFATAEGHVSHLEYERTHGVAVDAGPTG